MLVFRVVPPVAIVFCFVCLLAGQNWPSFRGENASGNGDGQNPPIYWDAQKKINILWKTPIPGLGHSSPVVWGQRIFVTTAISSDPQAKFRHGLSPGWGSAEDASQHLWRVYCVNKKSGEILWERTAHEGEPKVKRHVKASHANPTPATDGEHLVAFFGSEGLYCYDLEGSLLWQRDLGVLHGGASSVPDLQLGFGSSPIIYKNLVIVQCDTQKDSFITALNVDDGTQLWRSRRLEDTSWSTPTVYERSDHAELITSGTHYYRGYDPLTGKELWRLTDGVDGKIPTPIFSDDLLLFGGGSRYGNLYFYAVRPGARGNISLKQGQNASRYVAWRNRAKPYVGTPIVYGEYLYVCTANGILTLYNLETGKRINRVRIGRGVAVTASPVAADGRIYLASEDGVVFVVKVGGGKPEVIAANSVEEVIMATPAISKGMIIVRGQHHLFGIAENTPD